MGILHTFACLCTVLVLVLAAAPRVAAMSEENCRSLEKLTSRPDMFRFGHMDKWSLKHKPDCCQWPGVSCLGAAQFQLYLTDVSGNGTVVDIAAPVSYLHVEPRGRELVALPTCSFCHDHCMSLLALVGRQHAEAGWPHIELPDLRGWCVTEILMKRLVVKGAADMTLIHGDRNEVHGGVGSRMSLLDVHFEDKRLTLPTRGLTMERVSGVELIRPNNASVVRHSLTAAHMPDLVECEGSWRVEAGAERLVLLMFSHCPHLRFLPHGIGGHVLLSLDTLPSLLHLPMLRDDVYSVGLVSINASLVRNWALPTSSQSLLKHLTLVDCGLRDTDLPPRLPPLLSLDMSVNELTEVPIALLNLTTVERLVLDHNPIATLPPEWPPLVSFSCERCRLDGVVDISDAALNEVNLAWNAITGVVLSGRTEGLVNLSHNALETIDMPASMSPDQLHTLDLSYNRLTLESGVERVLFGPLSSSVNVSHNALSGSLAHFVLPSSIEHLVVSHNQITRLPPLGVGLHHGASAIPFVLLDASYNAIDHLDVQYLDERSRVSNHMAYCDLSGNRLTRWSELRRLLREANALRTFRAEANELVHNEPHKDFFPNALPLLTELSLRNNSFTGPVPPLDAISAAARTVELRDSGFTSTCETASEAHKANGTASCLGSVTTGALVTTTRGALCPEMFIVLASGREVSSDLAPSYHSFKLCECKFGFCMQADELRCAAAPENVLCRGGQHSSTPTAMKGHFLIEDERCAAQVGAGSDDDDGNKAEWLHVEECPREFRAQCSPGSDLSAALRGDMDDSACGEGYEGRFCSDCSDGFFRWVGNCLHCPSHATTQGVAAVSIVVLVLGALFAAFVMDESHDSTFKVVVFSLQTAGMIGYLHASFAPFMRGFLQVCGVALGDIPYMNGCVEAHGALSSLHGALIVLGLVFGVPLTAFLFGQLWLLRPGTAPEAAPAMLRRCVRAFCVLYWAAFQKLMLVLPMYFQCTSDTCTGESYLARFPFARCTGDARDGSIAATVLYCVLCVPLPFALSTWAMRRVERGRDALGTEFLLAGYRDGWQWWEMLLFAIKVLVGLFASLAIGDRVFSAFFVTLVALVLYLFHSKATPHDSVSSNQSAGAIILCAVVTLGCTMASNSAALSGAVGFSALFVLVQTGALAVAVAYMVGLQVFSAKVPWLGASSQDNLL